MRAHALGNNIIRRPGPEIQVIVTRLLLKQFRTFKIITLLPVGNALVLIDVLRQ